MSNSFLNLLGNLPFRNLDLLSVGITIAAISILGFVIYINDRKSVTNRSFFYLSLAAACWSIFNYLNYQSASPELVLILLRFLMFFAVAFSLSLFQLSYVFPRSSATLPKWYKYIVIPASFVVCILTLTPLVFNHIVGNVSTGTVAAVAIGPGIVLFAILVFFLIGGGIFNFIRKTLKTQGTEKKQFEIVLVGIVIMFGSIVPLDFILPAFFGDYTFIPFGALFVFPFVACTSYAIYKHHLFKIKVVAIAFVAFILTIFSFVNILYAVSASQIIINVTLFVAVLLGSIILIRSVLKEIEQRERIQILADDLSKANENQVALIHFITHQVKGFFTKSRDIFSLITEGEAGPLTPEMQRYVKEGFDSDTKGVAMVEDVLNAANIKSGIVKYNIAPFDLSNLIGALVAEYRGMAKDKDIALTYSCWGKDPVNGTNDQVANCAIDMKTHGNYIVNGDEGQLRQVFKNLIENAIRYTPKGSVIVRLTQSVADSAADHTVSPKIVFSVRDSGVGLTDDDKAVLFTQGGRGKDSTKVNVESTGYGLFIAKGIVEAHHGRIWAESEGRDKGATFSVELPGVAASS